MPRLLVLCFLPFLAFAQQSVELHQAFLDLQHDGVLMNLSAHPDDEDGSSLAYYRMKYGVKTYSVFFTRGEGGQNETGSELYEELGVLRTAETETAARIQGTEARFLNFKDFGYSKTATETFRKWGGKKEVLRRLVYMIRKLKPDILFTNHNTVDGHGHHQAAAITAVEAFDAAADSAYFPEQLKESGLTLWQPRKLYFRIFTPGKKIPDVVNNIQEVDSVHGVSYLEIAKRALRMHKTQGMDKVDLSGFSRRPSLWELVRSNSQYVRDTTDFFAGVRLLTDENSIKYKEMILSIKPDLSADSALVQIEKVREGRRHVLGPLGSRGIQMRYLDTHYNDTVLSNRSDMPIVLKRNHLVEKPLGNLPMGHPDPLFARIHSQWMEDLGNLQMKLCGVELFWHPDPLEFADGDYPHFKLTLKSSRCVMSEAGFSLTGPPEDWGSEEVSGMFDREGSGSFTRPFPPLLPRYSLPKVIGQYNPIEWETNLNVTINMEADHNRLQFSLRKPYGIAPRHHLHMLPRLLRMTEKGRELAFTVRNYAQTKMGGGIRAILPKGWSAEAPQFDIKEQDSIATGSVFVRPPSDVPVGDYTLKFETEFSTDTVVARIFDVAVATDTRVGIIKSYDNTLEMACSELGVQHKLLEEEDLARGNLNQWTTIVVDIRAYLVREDLKKYNTKLLEYIKNGGNLVVMYQRDQEWKPEFAPYPFQITRQRVSVEEAPVKVLVPQHQLFRQPNTIGMEDWKGWIQERAVYFPVNVAPEYSRLLSSNDPDEPELDTGYLLASYGQGSYIYTSYVWYRQLKEMHPGAFRCFANMISYPKYRK